MNSIEQEIEVKKKDFDCKPIQQKTIQNSGHLRDICPDCGAPTRVEGRCRYCACCGWSACS